jgi:hypothetical protein
MKVVVRSEHMRPPRALLCLETEAGVFEIAARRSESLQISQLFCDPFKTSTPARSAGKKRCH